MSTILRLAVCFLAVMLVVEAAPWASKRASNPDATCRNDQVGFHCYLCGKLMDDPRVYDDCCADMPPAREFCNGILA